MCISECGRSTNS